MDLGALTDALKRYLNLVMKPDEEWSLVVAQNPSTTEALFPFTVMGGLVSLLCAVLGIALRIGEKSWPLEILAHLIGDVVSVGAFVAASILISSRVDAVRPSLGGTAALYAATGMWLTALLTFVPIPVLGWIRLVMGVVYTGYLYHRALDLAVGVPGHRRIFALSVALGALLGAGALVRLLFTLVLASRGVW